MKKLLLIISLLISSCQITDNQDRQPAEIVNGSEEGKSIIETRNQFESKNLGHIGDSKQRVKVALFLPFSGKNQDLGWSLANSALMSLFDNDDDRNIELVFIDSKGDPKQAKQLFSQVISDQIKIVIGPIFSSVAKEIKADAIKNDITIISFSNNRELMTKIKGHGGLFLAGMMPETEIDAIIDYTMKQNKTRFSILAPRTKYGNVMAAIFKKIVKDRDGTFITSEFYKPSQKSLNRAVNRVVNAFVIDPEIEINNDTIIEEEQREYAEVLMIPESGKILSKIIETIKKQNTNERELQILGSSNWDDISTLNDYRLSGSWFSAPENDKFREFEKSYYKHHEKFPPRIASISYDLILALSIIIEENNGKKITSHDLINYEDSPRNGFKGIDGLFRFLPNGLIQRNLAILEVDNGKFRTLEEAEDRFLKY